MSEVEQQYHQAVINKRLKEAETIIPEQIRLKQHVERRHNIKMYNDTEGLLY